MWCCTASWLFEGGSAGPQRGGASTTTARLSQPTTQARVPVRARVDRPTLAWFESHAGFSSLGSAVMKAKAEASPEAGAPMMALPTN